MPPSYFFKFHFNSILPPMPMSLNWLLHFKFLMKMLYVFLTSCVPICTIHHILPDLIILAICSEEGNSWSCFYYSPLRPVYAPGYLVLENPLSKVLILKKWLWANKSDKLKFELQVKRCYISCFKCITYSRAQKTTVNSYFYKETTKIWQTNSCPFKLQVFLKIIHVYWSGLD
jgi:hypothetical protein